MDRIARDWRAAATHSASHSCSSSALCARCNTPLDAKYFDASSVVDAPLPGRSVIVARFELPAQYCGVLEYFSQYTDAYGNSPVQVETPGLLWTLRVNQRPLHPYIDLDHIVNPWGYGSFQVGLRLDESATVEFMVRATQPTLASSISAAIVGSPTEQSVAPASMDGIVTGGTLLVDPGSQQEEEVTVTAISANGLAFSAIFRNSHNVNVVITERSVKLVGGRIVGRYWYNPEYGDVGR